MRNTQESVTRPHRTAAGPTAKRITNRRRQLMSNIWPRRQPATASVLVLALLIASPIAAQRTEETTKGVTVAPPASIKMMPPPTAVPGGPPPAQVLIAPESPAKPKKFWEDGCGQIKECHTCKRKLDACRSKITKLQA